MKCVLTTRAANNFVQLIGFDKVYTEFSIVNNDDGCDIQLDGDQTRPIDAPTMLYCKPKGKDKGFHDIFEASDSSLYGGDPEGQDDAPCSVGDSLQEGNAGPDGNNQDCAEFYSECANMSEGYTITIQAESIEPDVCDECSKLVKCPFFVVVSRDEGCVYADATGGGATLSKPVVCGSTYGATMSVTGGAVHLIVTVDGEPVATPSFDIPESHTETITVDLNVDSYPCHLNKATIKPWKCVSKWSGTRKICGDLDSWCNSFAGNDGNWNFNPEQDASKTAGCEQAPNALTIQISGVQDRPGQCGTTQNERGCSAINECGKLTLYRKPCTCRYTSAVETGTGGNTKMTICCRDLAFHATANTSESGVVSLTVTVDQISGGSGHTFATWSGSIGPPNYQGVLNLTSQSNSGPCIWPNQIQVKPAKYSGKNGRLPWGIPPDPPQGGDGGGGGGVPPPPDMGARPCPFLIEDDLDDDCRPDQQAQANNALMPRQVCVAVKHSALDRVAVIVLQRQDGAVGAFLAPWGENPPKANAPVLDGPNCPQFRSYVAQLNNDPNNLTPIGNACTHVYITNSVINVQTEPFAVGRVVASLRFDTDDRDTALLLSKMGHVFNFDPNQPFNAGALCLSPFNVMLESVPTYADGKFSVFPWAALNNICPAFAEAGLLTMKPAYPHKPSASVKSSHVLPFETQGFAVREQSPANANVATTPLVANYSVHLWIQHLDIPTFSCARGNGEQNCFATGFPIDKVWPIAYVPTGLLPPELGYLYFFKHISLADAALLKSIGEEVELNVDVLNAIPSGIQAGDQYFPQGTIESGKAYLIELKLITGVYGVCSGCRPQAAFGAGGGGNCRPCGA